MKAGSAGEVVGLQRGDEIIAVMDATGAGGRALSLPARSFQSGPSAVISLAKPAPLLRLVEFAISSHGIVKQLGMREYHRDSRALSGFSRRACPGKKLECLLPIREFRHLLRHDGYMRKLRPNRQADTKRGGPEAAAFP
jgi:hypothetical protein